MQKTPKMNAVVWFEIPVKDLNRAKKFYEKVFNVKLKDGDMPGMKFTMFPDDEKLYGTTGALVASENAKTCSEEGGTVVYFSCEELDNELARIKDNGGKVLVPKMSIGEHGFVAHFLDTEGNRVALHSMK